MKRRGGGDDGLIHERLQAFCWQRISAASSKVGGKGVMVQTPEELVVLVQEWKKAKWTLRIVFRSTPPAKLALGHHFLQTSEGLDVRASS